MDISAELKAKGWNLSKDGLELCKSGLDRVTVQAIIQKALNIDMREIGGHFFPEDMKGAKLESLSGSGVVQIQKIKNATAPKYEYGSGAPPILRLLLTDGNTFINCLQWGTWKSISMDTPPGTKIYLKPGKIPMQNSFLLLSEHHFNVLGGCVTPLVEKWELNRSLASHVRTKENLDGTGPPPWIPFGKPISTIKTKSGIFRALDPDSKEIKEDEAFKQQRLANIAEVARAKEGKAKVFGGGKDKLPNAKQEPDSYQHHNSNEFSGQNKQQRNYNDTEFRQPPRAQNEDRAFRNNRNDRNWSNEDAYKSQMPNSNYGQPFSKDKRLDQRNNKFNNSNGFQNPRNQGSYQQRPYENTYRENSSEGGNAPRKFQRNFNENPRGGIMDRFKYDRTNDIEDLSHRISQVKLHGYDTQNDGKVFIPSKPFLKPGTEVNAKYWEDEKFYRATVHAVGQEGKTCVVHFMEYGNYEEVLVDDVQPLQVNTFNSGWNAGPISFQPSHWEGGNSTQDFPAISEFQPSSNRPQNHRHGGNSYDRHKNSRQDGRPSVKLYEPPQQRR